MAEQITNYQCPACTGPLHYSESLGKLKCDYCGTEYEVAEIEAMPRRKKNLSKPRKRQKKRRNRKSDSRQRRPKRAGILRISVITGARMQQA